MVLLEATGGLELPLVAALAAAALPVVVVNRRDGLRQGHRYPGATGGLDAAVLAHFADAVLRCALSETPRSSTLTEAPVLTNADSEKNGHCHRGPSPHRSPYRLVGTGVEHGSLWSKSNISPAADLPGWALWTDGRSRLGRGALQPDRRRPAHGWPCRCWRITWPAGPCASGWPATASVGEPVVTTKTLRRRFFSIAGRLTHSARRLTLHLPQRWPWATEFSRALARLRALPFPA